jgi:predicted nicotinamide N-methyase
MTKFSKMFMLMLHDVVWKRTLHDQVLAFEHCLCKCYMILWPSSQNVYVNVTWCCMKENTTWSSSRIVCVIATWHYDQVLKMFMLMLHDVLWKKALHDQVLALFV